MVPDKININIINIRHTWIRIRVAQLTEQVNKYQIADIDVEELHKKTSKELQKNIKKLQKNFKRTSKKHQNDWK